MKKKIEKKIWKKNFEKKIEFFLKVRILTICRTSGPDVMSGRALILLNCNVANPDLILSGLNFVCPAEEKESWNKKKSLNKPVSFLFLASHHSILEYDKVLILNIMFFSTSQNWKNKFFIGQRIFLDYYFRNWFLSFEQLKKWYSISNTQSLSYIFQNWLMRCQKH